VTDQELQLAEAIKELRVTLNETQQRFSDHIGVVVRTVARWELEKPPSQPAVLFRLAEVAKTAGREDLARIFDRATLESFVAGIIKQSEDFPASRPSSQLRALVWLMRAEPSAVGFHDRLDTFLIKEITGALLERGFASEEEARLLGDLGERAFAEYTWKTNATEHKVSFPEAVRQLRDDLSLSDEQFADRLEVTAAALRRIEQGKGQPTPSTLVKLLQIADEHQLPSCAYFEHACFEALGKMQDSAKGTPQADERQALASDDSRKSIARVLDRIEIERALHEHARLPKLRQR